MQYQEELRHVAVYGNEAYVLTTPQPQATRR